LSDAPPNAELLRSLGRLVRGLSALFWGLPIALIACFYTALTAEFRNFNVVPAVVSTGLLVFGVWQLGDFQKQERVWRHALDRGLILSLIVFFLSPFLYWWCRDPANQFFLAMVIALAVSGLFFLGSLNLVLQRLGAMLPDEALRLETKQFTAWNLNILAALFVLAAVHFAIGRARDLPLWVAQIPLLSEPTSQYFQWLLLMLTLLPLAMTMALLWKTKEVILDSVFGAER
jgi:hypothetical protein